MRGEKKEEYKEECLYLDMVFVVSLYHRVRKEIVFRIDGLSLTPCPFYILFLSSQVVIVIHQTQHQLDPVLSGFRYYEVQSLPFSTQSITVKHTHTHTH